jgi:hypothetical protein
MKKISSFQKNAIVKYALKKRLRALKRRAYLRGAPCSEYHKVKGKLYRNIILPTEMDFSKNKHRTLEFIKKFREVALVEKALFRLNFNHLKHLSPSASIVLLAEIYRCWKINGVKVHSTPINSCKLSKTLEAMGFYELLETSYLKVKRTQLEKDKTKVYIKFATAVKDDGRLADEIREAVINESPTLLSMESRDRIYRGLLECMSNVSRHAYGEEYVKFINYPNDERRWWLSGYVDKNKGEVLIQFYDQGAGIPNTLLTRRGERFTQKVKTFVANNPEGALIKRATEMGQSSTKKAHRGKGLPEIVNVIKNTTGRLKIISHRGEYKIYNENGIITEEYKDSPLSLNGTLIQWRVKA